MLYSVIICTEFYIIISKKEGELYITFLKYKCPSLLLIHLI